MGGPPNKAILCLPSAPFGLLFPLVCRFSDAGSDDPSTRFGRPASEKRQGTKSREVGHRRCRGVYGDLAAASGWARLDQSARSIALPRRMGMGDGLNERNGRFWTWLAGRLRAELSIRSKRGLCWPRGDQSGESQWAGESVWKASCGLD